MPDAAGSDKAREMVDKFLSLAGIEDEEIKAEAGPLIHRQIAEISAVGLRESDLAVMGQAYIRAVGRVVAAEVEVISRLRAGTGADSRRQFAAVAERMGPLGRDVFDTLHDLLLRREVSGGPGLVDRSRRSLQPSAVAHVDVINSTALLENATLADTQRLVDGLFASAQAALRGRIVEVVKYVGDGVFLLGANPAEVAAASLDCVAALASEVGLNSRAGLAFGRVVHRAGDVFGLTVNVAARLTKIAAEGRLLAAALEPVALPPSMCHNPREVSVRGLGEPLVAYELAAVG